MLNNRVLWPGTLLFHEGKIYVEGVRLREPGMCREHVIFACLHVAQELMRAAQENIAEPGGAKNACADLPGKVAEALGLDREWRD